MLGIGATLRPEALPLAGESAATSLGAWAPLVRTGGQRAALWIGDAAACACDARSIARLRDVFERLDVVVREVPHGPPGVALVDASGAIRYVGEAGALAARCGGNTALLATWLGDAARGEAPAPVVTVACPCIT